MSQAMNKRNGEPEVAMDMVRGEEVIHSDGEIDSTSKQRKALAVVVRNELGELNRAEISSQLLL